MTKIVQFRKNNPVMKGKILIVFLLCSVSLVAFRSFSVYAIGGNIEGNIQNENGEWLGLVKVQLLSGSSVVATYTSSSNGQFFFNNINYGTYIVRFIKLGYAKTEETITLQRSEVNLGTIVLPNAIQISSSTISVIANPDAQISLPFTLENFGTSTETVELLTANPEGWNSRIGTNNYEIKKASLDAGQTMSLQLEFVVPSTVTVDEEYNVSIIAVGSLNTTFSFAVEMRNQSSSLPTLSLQSSILSMVANSGEKLLLPFNVNNIGDSIESITFSVNTPDDWFTRILSNNGREITKTSLAVGATGNFNLELIIPIDYTGETGLTLTAVGNTVVSLNFTLNIEPVSDSVMFCRFPGKLALPGDTVIFDLTLNNPFNIETRFEIFVESIPVNWTVYVTTSNDEAVNEIILGPSESVDLSVQVGSFISATTSENYKIKINAKSGEQTVGLLPLTVSLQQPGAIAEIGLSTKFPEVTVEAGKTFDYQLNLGNFGSLSRIVLFSVDAPANWKAVIKSGTSEISQLNIAPISVDGFEELSVEITPPSTVDLGTYNISVQVKSESGAVLAELDLKTTITGSYDLYLSMSTLLTSVVSGESTSCTATVTNRGFSTLSAVGLECEAEDGWDIKISPSQVGLLKPQESYSFNVNIETPKDTVSGDYLISLASLSDQVESNPMQLRVTVNASTSWGIFGIGIAIVVIVALVLVFRKFKRR